MAWASIRCNKIVGVSFDKDQLQVDESITVVALPDDICYDVMTGKSAMHNLLIDQIIPDLEPKPLISDISDTGINIRDHISGYGEFLYLPHWEFHLFGQITDKNLLKNRHFFIWDWRHKYGPEIAGSFPWQEFNQVRLSHPNDRISVIFDNSMEAPDYHNHLKPLCDQLIESGIRPKDILFWACIEEDDIPVSNIDTRNGYTIGMMRSIPTQEYETLYHFVMLARNPRPLRMMMANEILVRKLENYGNISCGAGQTDYNYADTPYIDSEHRHRFPFLLEGPIHYSDIQQYNVSNHKISKSAINVICETSQDESLGGVILWTKPFITEKTSKAFLLCQFPLMVSVPLMVDKLRRHGFDMFDDIIDHSYDTEQDPQLRIKMIGDQLEKLCNIKNIAEFRSAYWDRLVANRQALLKLFKFIEPYNANQLEEWLRNTQ